MKALSTDAGFAASLGAGVDPTLTIEVLTYMSIDALVDRYKKSPRPLL